MSLSHVGAIVVAGGRGERFGQPGGKQLVEIAGSPVVAWSARALLAVEAIEYLVIVCPPEQVSLFREAVESELHGVAVAFADSGDTRQQSVAAGLAELPSEYSTVVVHDGARPLIRAETVARALETLDAHEGLSGVVVGHPSVDTVKTVDRELNIVSTPDRDHVWAVQTPQVFRRDVLERAHAGARGASTSSTDDSALVEAIGGSVRVVAGERDNIKVTVPEDVTIAEAVLAARAGEESE